MNAIPYLTRTSYITDVVEVVWQLRRITRDRTIVVTYIKNHGMLHSSNRLKLKERLALRHSVVGAGRRVTDHARVSEDLVVVSTCPRTSTKCNQTFNRERERI